MNTTHSRIKSDSPDLPGRTRAGASEPAPFWPRELYPFASLWLDSPFGRLHYVDEGSGPTLLLLPPAPLWSFMYRAAILRLRSRFRCVAFDFPGFGPSRAAAPPKADLRGMSRAVEHFLEALDLSGVTLVGHDSGGLVGLHAAGRQPKRFRGLALVDTIGFSLGRFSPIRLALLLVSSRAFGLAQERFNLLARLITTVGVRRRRLSEAERQAYLLAFPDRASRLLPLQVFREIATRRDFLAETERGLGGLADLPTLSVFGQLDPARLAGAQRRFSRVFSRHTRVVTRGEGHFVPEGAPEEFADALEAWWIKEFGQPESP